MCSCPKFLIVFSIIFTNVIGQNNDSARNVVSLLALNSDTVKLLPPFPVTFVRSTLLDLKFNEKTLLQRAFIHQSYRPPKPVASQWSNQTHYEPLDLIGDSAIRFLVDKYIIQHSPNLNNSALSKIRDEVVKHQTLAKVAVLNDYPSKVLSGPTEKQNIERFVSNQRDNKENDRSARILSRVFKAVAGAILVDNGFNMDKLEEIYMRMLREHIQTAITAKTA